MKTPMYSDTKRMKGKECEFVDSTKYRGMIGSLLYLAASKPDIMFSVGLCVRFQEDTKTSHREAVKRIFQYIKGTTHLRLWYPKRTGIEIVVYANSDYAGDYVDRKSTSGIFTFIGCCLTSWFSKKLTDLAISTNEAEYVGTKKACQQAQWMKQALIDYDIRLDDVSIMYDNKGVVDLSKDLMQHSQTKHIEISHHFLRDNVQKGNISIEKVSSEDNIADILTKPLKRESFNFFQLGSYSGLSVSYALLYRDLYEIQYCILRFKMNGVVVEYRYVLYDRFMYPLASQHERKTRKDYGMKRGRHSTSTSSSSAFDHPSSSHHVDDDNDENDEGTSRASTPSPTRFVNSLSNEIPQVFSNPPNDEQTMQTLFTRQTEILNRQVQMRDEHRSGLRSIKKGNKNLWKGKKK
ncbi:hypothetical protein Tco_1556286 [Tanacetum coccineum]